MMKHLPSVTKARYVRDYIIETTFDDGTRKAIDFTHWLDGPVFEPLKNKSISESFSLMEVPLLGRMEPISLPRLFTLSRQ
jgi:hypothetical protein